MKDVLVKYKHAFILFLIYFLSELIVNPLGEFPLNDDWAYTKSVLFWFRDGIYNIGDWPAMTLFTHLSIGLMFVKLFGFSFFILRLSTLIVSLIGLILLFTIVFKITRNSFTALIACCVLLFNPIYFNLSNTYMTDITFNTVLLFCLYFAFQFFEYTNWTSFLLFFISAIFLILTRQFALSLVIAFTMACLFVKQQRYVFFLAACLGTLIVLISLKLYEGHLKEILSSNAAYKFSGGQNPLSYKFWDGFLYRFKIWHATVLMHILVYTLPVTLLFAISLIKTSKVWIMATMALVSIAIAHFIFRDQAFPMGNVYSNAYLGAETFYENLCRDSKKLVEHSFSQPIEDAMFWFQQVAISIHLFLILLALTQLKLSVFSKIKNHPFLSFQFLFLISYSCFIFISDNYFDRYHIPLFTAAIIALTYVGRHQTPKLIFSFFYLSFFFCVAVFGTKDYLKINTIRWEAYHQLKQELKVPADKINGGFEVNCWNEGKAGGWYQYFDLYNFDYLIQYWKEPGFKNHQAYPFQRYFPFKRDTLFVFKKDTIIQHVD